MRVLNVSFHPGDRFRGVVNGDLFVVEKILKKGDLDCGWPVRSDTIYLRSEMTGAIGKIGLKVALCLLLEKVG